MPHLTDSQNVITGIIGATGKTGARVNDSLNAMGLATRPMSRHSDTVFDWGDRSGWTQALSGLHALYITYSPDLAVPAAKDDIAHLIEVAQSVDVKHLVLLSGRGEEGAQLAEKQLQNSGLEWNVVRASWFMQNFSESFMLDGVLQREVVLPNVSVKEPFIDVDDIVEIAVAALTRPELRNRVFDITGPELLSFADCVNAISDAINESVEYIPVSLDAYLGGMAEHGAPEDMLWLMNELFTEVLDGRNENTTNTIEDILGRSARSFAAYAKRVAHTGVWHKQQKGTKSEGAA